MNIPREGRATLADLLTAARHSLLAIIMPLIILGGIYGGVFTPTEAGAVAVVYSCVVSMLIYRELDLRGLADVIVKAGINSAVIFFVIATSQSFSWLITVPRISEQITESILGLSQNPFFLVTATNILLLFLGIFLETQAIILLVTPIILPILSDIGMEPVLIGIMIVTNTSVGMITPPMAVNLFVAAGLVKEHRVAMEHIANRVLPFLFAEIVGILLISNIPLLSLAPLWLIRG